MISASLLLESILAAKATGNEALVKELRALLLENYKISLRFHTDDGEEPEEGEDRQIARPERG